jgi:hypothetical protein
MTPSRSRAMQTQTIEYSFEPHLSDPATDWPMLTPFTIRLLLDFVKLDKIAAPIAQISALHYTGEGPNWVLFELTRRVISDPHEIVIRANQVHES